MMRLVVNNDFDQSERRLFTVATNHRAGKGKVVQDVFTLSHIYMLYTSVKNVSFEIILNN